MKWYALWIFACLGVVHDARAASLEVSPVGFELKKQYPSGVLRIKNTAALPIRIQIDAVEWSSDGFQEIFGEDTHALLLNPPIVEIAPEATQSIRFGLLKDKISQIANQEKSYRLIINEVPAENIQLKSGLQTILRVRIPVFITPDEVKQKLTWLLKRDVSGLALAVTNEGNVHTKINGIVWVNTNSEDNLQIKPTYVLSGQHKVWPLENKKLDTAVMRIKIQTNKGELEENVMVEADRVSSR